MADSRFFPTPAAVTLAEIVALTGVHACYGDGRDVSHTQLFHDIAPLDRADGGMVSFFDNNAYLDMFCTSAAGACFVRNKYRARAPRDMLLLITDEPYYAYAQLANHLYPAPATIGGIAPTAQVDARAQIGADVRIDAGAVIGAHAQIGDGCHIGVNSVIGEQVVMGKACRIGALCSISHTLMGDHVVLHRGVHIGQDGFGFAPSAQGVLKVPQLGRVVVGDYVDIGSGTCIDRGAGPDTIIGAHTKIDNLVQIGHNVQIGRYVFIAAQAGIAGSSRLGDFVMVGGQAGIAGHIAIGDHAKLTAQSGVMHDLAPNGTYGGSPAIAVRDWHRQTLALATLARKKTHREGA